MSLHNLDYLIENVIGPEVPYTRRTLSENLRPGGKFEGCARKLGNRWAFTEDIQNLLDRMLPNLDADPAQEVPRATHLP